jgi:regulator of telomere elongation helicase 1
MVLLPIEGIEVDFPFPPYGVQLQYMARMISALRAGNNACLESPTGTGKSLSLLCAALAWRQAYVAALQLKARGGTDEKLFKAVGLKSNTMPPPPPPSAAPSSELAAEAPPEAQVFGGSATGVAEALAAAIVPGAGPVELRAPRIVFSSRTHSQLAQAIGELKSTVYRPYMTVLASRDQLCIHDMARKVAGSRLNTACRALTAPSRRGCKYHLAVMSPRDHENRSKALLQLLKDEPPKDIEDLTEFGMREGACPWYLTRHAASSGEVEVLFVPYNYLIDRNARDSLDLDWANDVIIIDEAHNLESICSEALSFDLTPAVRIGCHEELQKCIDKALTSGGVSFPALDELAKTDHGAAQVIGSENREALEFRLLLAMLKQIEDAIKEVSIPSANSLNVSAPLFASHPGTFLRQLFSGVNSNGVTESSAPLVLEVLERAIDSSSGQPDRQPGHERSPDTRSNSPGFLRVLHNAIRVLFSPLSSTQEKSFRSVIYPADSNNPTAERTISYWCFSPAVAMKEFLALRVRSLVLTSGTLSPMDSFACELGVEFPVRLENRHVIGADQVWAGVVCTGPDGVRLSSGYKTRESDEYKISLGRSLIKIAQVVPDGMLVFFPSYRAMDSSVLFWKSVGLGDHGQKPSIFELLLQRKRIVVEPREAADFAAAILAHQTNIQGGHGSILLAVCRGKVSEGIDFSDAYGRAVIMAGIPYPAAFDPKVTLKRDYMNERVKLQKAAAEAGSNEALSLNGEEWYTLQAVRAINQAVGRAIRHRNDYGVVLLCDERFSSSHLLSQLSKWLRPYAEVCSSFDSALTTMVSFFSKAEQSAWGQAANIKLSESRRILSEGGSDKLGQHASASRRPSAQEESVFAVATAAKAIEQFLVPRRSEAEMQSSLNRITAQMERCEKMPMTGEAVHSLLDVLGSRPQHQSDKTQGHSNSIVPDPIGSKAGPSTRLSSQFIAQHAEDESTTQPRDRSVVKRTGVHGTALPGKKMNLAEEAAALFDAREPLRAMLGQLKVLCSLAKEASESEGPLQECSVRGDIISRGNAEAAKLVRGIRDSRGACVSKETVEQVLNKLRVKVPAIFREGFDTEFSIK